MWLTTIHREVRIRGTETMPWFEKTIIVISVSIAFLFIGWIVYDTWYQETHPKVLHIKLQPKE
jgi:hypothetical protein